MSTYKSVNNNREDARKEIMFAMVRLTTFSQTGLSGRMDAADWHPSRMIVNAIRLRYYVFCHIPGLVCQDRPPMNIFLEKKDDSIRLAVQSRVVGGRGSGHGETAGRG